MQIDNDKYRASIESGHQMLQAQLGDSRGAAASSSQAAQQYQYKFMQHEATSQSSLLSNDRQKSHVAEQQEPSQPAN